MTKAFKESEFRDPPEAQKKSYAPPQVFKYGTLREITLTVGNSGNLDGGSGSAKRSLP